MLLFFTFQLVWSLTQCIAQASLKPVIFRPPGCWGDRCEPLTTPARRTLLLVGRIHLVGAAYGPPSLQGSWNGFSKGSCTQEMDFCQMETGAFRHLAASVVVVVVFRTCHLFFFLSLLGPETLWQEVFQDSEPHSAFVARLSQVLAVGVPCLSFLSI